MSSFRYFHSIKHNTNYCLQKSGQTLCLFKNNKKGYPVPVLGKRYSTDESGLDVITRYKIVKEDSIIPTTTIFRNGKHPVAFAIHKNYGNDLYGALMNGRVVSLAEDDTINLRMPQKDTYTPMAMRFWEKIREYFGI